MRPAIKFLMVAACVVLAGAGAANDDELAAEADLTVDQVTPGIASPGEHAAADEDDTPVCGDKNYCKEMRTCSEAVHYLEDCGLGRLDADNDGIPCETICGKTKATMSARIRAQPWVDSATDSPSEALALVPDADEEGFTCGKKRTCKQMNSCEEARFYLQKCGVRSLDRNRDGIPCNGLC